MRLHATGVLHAFIVLTDTLKGNLHIQVARLEVIGMHCSSCSTAVEKAL